VRLEQEQDREQAVVPHDADDAAKHCQSLSGFLREDASDTRPNEEHTPMPATAATATTTAHIPARGPFSWSASLDVVEHFSPVRRHADTGRDPLRMTFLLDGTFEPVGAAVREVPDGLDVEVVGTADVAAAANQIARVFSLDHDGSGFPAIGDRDPAFGAIQRALPGLRPVCFTSPYECAAWGVISQRISMRQAAMIQDRLVGDAGSTLEVAGQTVRAFPQPDALLTVDAVPSLPAEKIARLHSVAEAALEGRLDAERLRALGPVDGPASLRSIRGIGEFWSSGIYLRGCGIVDEWAAEPISNAALGALHGLGDRPTAAEVERLTDAFRPYRMWAAFLLRVAANRGLIPGIAGREMRIREAATGKAPRSASRG
jgi:DNA-3-methyladenine glycosylase II